MKIRNSLSLKFTGIFAVILIIVLGFTYFMAKDYANTESFLRLKERSFIISQYFFEKDELSETAYEPYKARYLQSLPDEIIQVFDQFDDCVFLPRNDKIHYSKSTLSKIRREGEINFTQGAYKIVGISYHDNQGDFVILVSASNHYEKDRLDNLLIIILISFIVSLVASYFLGQFFSKKALEPIRKVVMQAKTITASNLHLRIEEGKAKDEIHELSNTFNSMLSRLESAFVMQRTFISNASHELRTPLTVALSEMEILLSKNRSVEEYKTALTSAIFEFEKLADLLNNLLNLAQANQESPDFEIKEIRLDELLWDIKNDVLRKNESADISIEYKNLPADEMSLVIKGNPQTLGIAISNLIQNACKFSENQNVVCELVYTDDALIVNVIDKGIGIASSDLKNILQPFCRGNNAIKYSGYGIGLALADKIVAIHGGKMNINSVLNEGTTVCLIFPVSV